MAQLLSPEWFEIVVAEAATLPERRGASGRVRLVVGEAKRAEQRYEVVFLDGRVTSAGLGGEGDVDVELLATGAILSALATGQLDSQTALMQGKLKSSSTGPILRLLPVLQSPEWGALEAAVAAQTQA
ncbi:MAG: SCP2 sterol-binding domain-containing protein [Acidimicrobiales bacterium]